MNTEPTLRPYLETIEKQCQPLQREELIELILNLAKQMEPGERNSFLQTFRSAIPGNNPQPVNHSLHQDKELLCEINGLRHEIEDRIRSIEDGTYWDNPDDEDECDDPYYLDDEPDPINDFQEDSLITFFKEADQHYLHGNKTVAQSLYGALFSLIDATDIHTSIPEHLINLKESRARLARCVYELTPQDKRVDAMLVAMDADLKENGYFKFGRKNREEIVLIEYKNPPGR